MSVLFDDGLGIHESQHSSPAMNTADFILHASPYTDTLVFL